MDIKRSFGNSGKTAMIILLFLLIIVLFQLSRMGLLDRNENIVQPEQPIFKTVSNPDFIDNSINNVGKIAIVYDTTATDRKYILDNFKSLFSKLKISYNYFEAKNNTDFTGYSLVIPIIGDYEKSPIIVDVFNYLEAGGNAYFPIEPVDNDSFFSVYTSLGVMEKTHRKQSNKIIDKKGILGEENAQYTFATAIDMQYFLRLRSDCDVYFTDDTGNPLLWKKQVSKGIAYVSNCDYLSSFCSRGVIMEIIYELLKKDKNEIFIYPNYGVSTLILDQFPSSFVLEKSKILSELNVMYSDFISKYYWSFIDNILKKFKAKPTLSYVAASNDNTDGEFTVDISRNNLMLYSTEVFEKYGEIAFSGYSKFPLGLDGELDNVGWFKPWSSYGAMKEAFAIAKKPVYELYPNYQIKVYIPPNSRISNSTLTMMGDICPNLKTIVTNYSTWNKDQLTLNFESGVGDIFFYSATTDYNGIIWNTINSLYSLGVFSPMLNVNEMLIENSISYKDYEQSVNEAFSFAKQFPNLQNMTVSEASNYIEKYNSLKYSILEDEFAIMLNIDNWFSGVSFKIRTNSNLISNENCEVFKYSDGLYIVYPKNIKVRIEKR